MSALDNLTEKQRRFVEAYFGEANGNGTEAARLAGYKGDDVTLASVGSENLRKPQIAAAVEAMRAERKRKAVLTRHQREKLLTKLALGKVEEPTVTKDGDVVYAPVKGSVRHSAIKTLGEMNGDFVEKVDVKITDALAGELDWLERNMSPGAFQELLVALNERKNGATRVR